MKATSLNKTYSKQVFKSKNDSADVLYSLHETALKAKLQSHRFYKFSDIDECTNSPCLNGATCNNNAGGYKCLCMPGFEGVNCGEGMLLKLFQQ